MALPNFEHQLLQLLSNSTTVAQLEQLLLNPILDKFDGNKGIAIASLVVGIVFGIPKVITAYYTRRQYNLYRRESARLNDIYQMHAYRMTPGAAGNA
ncbi:hypothetical protein MMC17_006558 [Xylographa soralifera]|nr:hypothetical protein [Xylographa soralifera]